MSSLLNTLKEAGGVSGFLYFADHSEDVFTLQGHHSEKFTYAMTQIPMLAWFSDKYREKYADKYKVIAANQDALFSNDFAEVCFTPRGGVTEEGRPRALSNSFGQ